MTSPICRGCGLPVEDGQARYTGREPQESWHYSCARPLDLAHTRRDTIRSGDGRRPREPGTFHDAIAEVPRVKKAKKRPRGGASVPCPRCGGPSAVSETRRLDEKRSVHRKRRCRDCSHTFESEEVAR